MAQKVNWKDTFDVAIKMSLNDLKAIIDDLSDAELIELITEILSDGGKVYAEVKKFCDIE